MKNKHLERRQDMLNFHEFIEEIKKEVREEIAKTVNGKIDKLSKDFKEHQEKMSPILEIYTTANTVGRFTKWVAGILIALGIIVGYIKGWYK